jgi:hypothetical protein
MFSRQNNPYPFLATCHIKRVTWRKISMDWKQYNEVKAGEKSKTKVTEIIEGKQEDFRSDAYYDKVEASKEELEKMKISPAINIKCENGADLVINVPASKTINPKSKLGMWKRTYGDYPEVGQEVTTKVDENGFQRIVLESV